MVADADGIPRAESVDFALDADYGDDSNDFALQLFDGIRMGAGWRWWIDGSELGGVVDAVSAKTTRKGRTVEYSGRLWSGILASRVICPPRGHDHRTAKGDANEALGELIDALGAGDVFAPAAGVAGIAVDYTFDRFCDAWSGIRGMLRASHARLSVRWVQGRAELSAVPVGGGGYVDDDLLDLDILQQWRCTNHLVCLGSGEMQNRTVLDLYADETGKVSETQTLFGVDEMAETYEYSNADEAGLKEEGAKKLAEMQTRGSVGATVRDGASELHIGDTVHGRDNALGTDVTGEVVQKTVKASNGRLSASYGIGTPSMV